MRYLLVFLLLCFTHSAVAKEDCSLQAIGLDQSSNIAERLFFTGTCHFRNENYKLSVKSWEQLSKLSNVDSAFEELQIDVLNNFGYLLFFGYGVEQDQQKAIGYWSKAVSMGHYESEYHLCHAHAEVEQPTYNLAKAKRYCTKALYIYRGMNDPDNEILAIVERYYARISAQINDEKPETPKLKNEK